MAMSEAKIDMQSFARHQAAKDVEEKSDLVHSPGVEPGSPAWKASLGFVSILFARIPSSLL